MLGFAFSEKIYLYSMPTDMRKSFNGLSGIVINQLQKDPVRDGMFIFINKRRDRLKVLVWDRHGFWLLYKRLEAGRFQLPLSPDAQEPAVTLAYDQLMMILEGIDLRWARHRKRFTLPHI